MIPRSDRPAAKNLMSVAAFAFLLIGFFLLAIDALVFISVISFLKSAAHAEGIVTGLALSNNVYHPEIEFSADGELVRYRESVGTNPPLFREGDKVGILYDRDNLQNARLDNFFSIWFMNLVLTFIAIMFIAIPAGIIYSLAASEKMKESLKKTGKKIYARIEEIREGREFTIIAKHEIDGKEYMFVSEPIIYDPRKYLMSDFAKIFIDPKNPENYVFDTSFLPKLK